MRESPLNDVAGGDLAYRMYRFPGGAQYPCLDFRQDQQRVFLSLVNENANLSAAKHVSKARAITAGLGACYVISERGSARSKIGFSTDPIGRVNALRRLHDGAFFIVGLLWAFHHQARVIECNALRLAKSRGVRSDGEWVSLSGESTARLVLDSAWRQQLFTDSRCFLEQWVPIATDTKPERYWTNARVEEMKGLSGISG